MRVAWVAILVACGSSTPAPVRPPPPASHVAQAEPHAAYDLRERAEHALHSDTPLDYERPFKAKPIDRSGTAKLFGDACRAGDKRACIIEAQLVSLDERGDSFRSVLANCRAGDLISCRALPLDAHAPRFPEAAGAMSRSEACQKTPVAPPCDVDALRRECSDGFPAACGELSSVDDLRSDDGKLLQHYPQLSLRGCKAGIAAECLLVTQYGSETEQLENMQRLCDLRRDQCWGLASILERKRDTAGQRDNLERTCQYGGTDYLCLRLGEDYVNGTLEEPVPGRGRALVDFACTKLGVAAQSEPSCGHAHMK